MNAKSAKLIYPDIIFYGEVTIKENVEIGKGTRIGEYVFIGDSVRIGKNCRIIYHASIPRGTRIGDDVFIGPNTTLLNDKYPPTHISNPPTIHSDAVIGGGVTILPSVVIGEGAVVGGGSVVTKDVPPWTVVFGCPAKFYCTRAEYEKKRMVKI